MPLFKRSKKKTEERAISYQDLWGSGADINAVRGSSIETALTLVPVYAATRLIADSIASLPLQTYRKVDGSSQPLTSPTLLTDPSLFGGPFEWVQRPLLSLLLRGNAYGLITQTDAVGRPRQVEWLHPDEVTLEDNRAVRRPVWKWNGKTVQAWTGRESGGQLLHIPGYTLPGQILGMSPIRAYATTVETGILSQRFGRDWFQNGAIPAGVLETDQPVTEGQADIIKARFRKSASGRDPVVLGAGTSYKPITVNPDESQFLATIKATATQVASIYGIPPEMIGGELPSGSMTYANVEQRSLNFATYTLRPYLTKLEQALSTLLPRPQFVRFNLDALVRADLKTRYQAHALGLASGFLAVDEVRDLEDRPPMEPADLLPPDPEPDPVPDLQEEQNA